MTQLFKSNFKYNLEILSNFSGLLRIYEIYYVLIIQMRCSICALYNFHRFNIQAFEEHWRNGQLIVAALKKPC